MQILKPLGACILAALFGMTSVHAQEFQKPIRFIVPFGAGGATDALARMVAPRISKELGQSVIIENRTGASGQIGTQLVKGGPSDGTVFLVTTEHPVVILPFITPDVGYAAERDFQIVGKIASLQWALSVPATTGAKTLNEFVEYIKRDPVRANYAVPSVGGVPEMIGVVVGKKASMEMTVLPYAGGAAIIPHLMGGQISSGVTGAPEAVNMQKTGKVNVLAISGIKRSAHLANVPTFEELGFRGLTAESWFAVFAPKGLPRPMAERFNQALRVALSEPEVQQKISDMSIQAAPATLDEAALDFREAVAFWRTASKAPSSEKR